MAGEGMTLAGTHHRGIDDARNITQLFLRYFDHWQFPPG
jgi:inhibitor of KinA sporulation pathway (predicted exonuclease)